MKIKILKAPVLFAVFFSLSLAPAYVRAEPAAQQTVETFLKTLQSMNFPIQDAAAHAKLIAQADGYLDMETMGRKSLAAHSKDSF